MPKVRDLGINFIPATMRPLEIGEGGGIPPCEPSGCERTYGDCEPSGCAKEASCIEPTSDCEPSGCEKGASCHEPSGDKDKTDKYERPLNAAAIAQLKQQMQARLGA
ncbi:MAG TPA: hypothetical protein VEO54_12490 [Thermoanaerobaculia bacterium]|nr:hypothetical protein [Thermoanaerobaculia bacterium]